MLGRCREGRGASKSHCSQRNEWPSGMNSIHSISYLRSDLYPHYWLKLESTEIPYCPCVWRDEFWCTCCQSQYGVLLMHLCSCSAEMALDVWVPVEEKTSSKTSWGGVWLLWTRGRVFQEGFSVIITPRIGNAKRKLLLGLMVCDSSFQNGSLSLFHRDAQ